MFTITVRSSAGRALASARGEGEANLLYRSEYAEGDELVFEADQPRVCVRVDACVPAARMYLPDCKLTYRVPLGGDGLAPYAPGAFAGAMHLISISGDLSDERRNLACNPADQRIDVRAYPHASANVETRGESVFAARNVIDGVTIANGHGAWPYGSWGIGAREDAQLTLEFGRPVTIDEMILYLRADFPHDAHWVRGTVTLSDGASHTFPLCGVDGAQRVPLGEHTVTWLKLDKLIKCDNPSAFPSLRQIQVFGRG